MGSPRSCGALGATKSLLSFRQAVTSPKARIVVDAVAHLPHTGANSPIWSRSTPLRIKHIGPGDRVQCIASGHDEMIPPQCRRPPQERRRTNGRRRTAPLLSGPRGNHVQPERTAMPRADALAGGSGTLRTGEIAPHLRFVKTGPESSTIELANAGPGQLTVNRGLVFTMSLGSLLDLRRPAVHCTRRPSRRPACTRRLSRSVSTAGLPRPSRGCQSYPRRKSCG